MKFKKAVSVILMLAVVLSSFAAMGGFAVSASESTNLITNGGFDSDTTGWNVTGSNGNVESTSTGSLNSNLADGNVAKFLPKGDWLYQSIELKKGEYVLKFNAFATGNIFFGVYNDSVFSADSIIKYTAYSSVNHEGTVITSGGYGHNDVPYAYYEDGNANRKISYTFVLNESTTVYIAFKTYRAKTLYLDNVSLEKVKTELVNGDFETGDLTGFENASGSKIEIVNAKKYETDTTTFTGYAAYMPGGAADKANTLLQKVTLKPGTYTWSFDVDLITVNTQGWNFMFGVYTGLTSGGVGYGSKTSIGTATGKYTDGTNCGAINTNDFNGFYLSYGNKDLTKNASLTVTFTLEDTTVVYFDVRTSVNARAYVDNMTLIRTETELVNGDFEDGTIGWNVTPAGGATLTAVDATSDSGLTWAKGKAARLVTNNGTTAWMYQKIKLAAGTYTWEFTTENLTNHLYVVGVYNSATFGKDTLISGTVVNSHPADTKGWRNDLKLQSTGNAYEGAGKAKRYNKYTFELTEETVVYLALRTNATTDATLYVDNMILTLELNNGDANYDGTVDIRDMIRIKKMIADNGYNVGGDCNDDGKLDSTDLASLRKYLLLGAWTDNAATANSISLVD